MQLAFPFIVTAACCNLLVGILVYSRQTSRPTNKLFLYLTLSVAAWSLGIAFFLIWPYNQQNRFLVNFYYVAAWSVAAAVWGFSRAWVGKRVPSMWALLLVFVVIPAAVLFIDPSLIITNVHPIPSVGVTLNPATQVVYSVVFAALYVVGVAELFAGISVKKGVYRAQLRLLSVGFMSAGFVGIIFNLMLPWFGVYQYIWVGPVSSVLFVGCTAYAIVRHRLFDIHGFIVRSLGYIMSLIVLASLFGIVVFGIAKWVFHLDIDFRAQVFISAATALAAGAFSGLKAFFDRVSRNLFYREAYDAQELLDKLNRLFVTNTDLERLLRRTSAMLEESLHAQYCLFVIEPAAHAPQRLVGTGTHRAFRADDIKMFRTLTARFHHKLIVADELETGHESLRNAMESGAVSVLARLTSSTSHSGEELGYLLLGPRRSGNPYTTNDLRVLEIIANELVIAIENSLHFEEIKHFNQTLQQGVNDATRKLRRSNEKLQALDATKDDFITMASHQLRTPLTSVKGYLSMVIEGDVGKLNAQQRQLLTQSYLSSQRMVYLISDLLNLSRLNTGKFVIDPSPVDLDEIVQSELDQLYETARAREVTLNYERPSGIPKLMLDETKIRQVVMNLVDNAIYYTPSGGHIDVSVQTTKTSLEFRVKDDGIGVPRSVQHRLFTKFYRAENAQAARPDGTGLGLFMAKKVVVAQGGAIIFSSEEGKGSTFGFRFSLRDHKVE